jgi:hypothetical protein
MWFSALLKCYRRMTSARQPLRHRRHARCRQPVEALECRTLLTAYTATTAAQLIADINAANKSGGTNTITLTASTTSPYVFGTANSSPDGPTVLPVIKKGDNLTIHTANTSSGFGDTIDAAGHGRLFDVASGASLTLENVTLQNGSLFGSGVGAEGGAILNQGTLVLSSVMVQGNTAAGFPGSNFQHNKPGGAGADAAGGGIWSNGSLTLEDGTVIQANTAIGGDGSTTSFGMGAGGKAFGGGIYIAGGTADISGTTLGGYSKSGNTAQGGTGNNTLSNQGGSAYGGAVYVAAGTVTMSGDTVGSGQFAVSQLIQNVARGGAEPPGIFGTGNAYGGGVYVASGSVTLTNDIFEGNVAGTLFNGGTFVEYLDGYGGGIFIASGATVSMDSLTVTNTIDNSDSSGINFGTTANIDGTYILLP